MRIRRSLPILLAVVLVAAAVALMVVLRKHAPPEPARLLPSADGFAYINLQWMRRANITGELPPVPHDPDYERFINATGFQFERDLDEAAIAIHYPESIATVVSGQPNEARFSEVFVGKIQGERLRAYLTNLSRSVETYHAVDIYTIPVEDRTVRVAILGVDTVAASNHPDPAVIRGIIERSRKLASPFGGPALLRQYYAQVPFASVAWTIFRIQPRTDPAARIPSNLSFLFAQPAVVVASVRYIRALHLRAVAFTGSDAEAERLTGQLSAFLNLFQSLDHTTAPSATDADVKAIFDSLQVEQQKDRALLTATVPVGFIRKAMAEAPAAVQPAPPAPPPPVKKPARKTHP
ncbi:MAG: hypothetical protein WBQ09_18070 [Terriglobales bacterium]|jgi:hypothetical protein